MSNQGRTLRVRTLCWDVQGLLEEAGIRDVPVSLEMIGGGGKTAIIRKLIGFLERRGYLDYLVQAVHNMRDRK